LKKKFHQFQFNFYKEREMSDFRKLSLAFAAVTLFAGLASAQTAPPIVCSTTAQPLTVRAEGLTEQTGDVVIQCTGGQAPAAGAVVPVVNISVTLSTNITSRLLNDQASEALLFIDDPQPGPGGAGLGQQNPCAVSSGTTPVCTGFTASAPGPTQGAIAATGAQVAGAPVNVFQGVRQNDNTIVWLGVPIVAPGTQGTRIFRTKNIRAAIAGTSAENGQIFAFVSIQNPPANLQLNSSTVNVAFVQRSLEVVLRTYNNSGALANTSQGNALFACERFNSDLAADPTDGDYSGASNNGGRSFQLRYRELYAAAWKVRDINPALSDGPLSQNYPQNNNGAPPEFSSSNTTGGTVVESGFFNRDFSATNGLNRAGRADHGTRLRAQFNNVPANVRLYVSAGALSSDTISSTARNPGNLSGGGGTTSRAAAYGVVQGGGITATATVLVTPSSTAERGPLGGNLAAYPAGATQGLIEVPLTNGSGSFVWEVFGQDPTAIDTLSFAVSLAFRNVNNPGTGTMTVNGSYAPISTVNTMSSTAPIPRFQDTSTAANAANIALCQTVLLFPFVANQAGFDTGMAISNTTSDPFGTAPQTGNCELNYYGATTGGGAPPARQTTTTPLQGGQVATFTLSSGGTNGIAATPGFLGYIIAICNFRYAHGFAFISDVGAQRLSHGYLALVLDPSPRLARENAESLGM
jgi:hypothetical protein